VTVDGSWSDGANGGGSCTTGTSGACTIEKSSIKGNVSSAVFNVLALTHPDGHEHNTLADHDGDADSDGVSITVLRVPDDSGPVNSPPAVSISSPTSGASFESGASINFVASAQDDEDGALSGTISWTSDLDGSLGGGSSVAAVLSDGAHSVTASVTDSGGETSTDSVSITVGSTAELVAHVGDVTGTSEPGSRNKWTASVTVFVHNAAHTNPGSGITVSGSWSDGAKGGASCVTAASGQCTVSKGSLRGNSVTFTVDSLSGTAVTYDSGSSHVLSAVVIQP
jgi:hypothetical protein